jgi:hypothetical protein
MSWINVEGKQIQVDEQYRKLLESFKWKFAQRFAESAEVHRADLQGSLYGKSLADLIRTLHGYTEFARFNIRPETNSLDYRMNSLCWTCICGHKRCDRCSKTCSLDSFGCNLDWSDSD